ncbi:MAG: IclR family transcriptional regulator domain-containing protein [Steroidobacteraceae bacterium]
MADETGDTGEFITSLARGLAVLRAFTKERPELTLSQVASVTQLSPATARRCLHTLVRLGYATRRNKLFLLRPSVVAFASAYLESANLEQIVRPHLQDVRDKTGDSSSLAVLADAEILYLVHVSTNRMIRVPAAVGTRFPAYPTSLGRALLAHQPAPALEAYLRRTPFVALTEKTETSRAALRRILARVRNDGYASVQDELDYGIVSIAVPVVDASGEALAAINCSTSTARADRKSLVASRLPLLRAAARSIAAEMKRYPMLAHSLGHAG